MKVLDKAAFLALPEGVFFAEGKEWYFNGLSIKGETVIVDGQRRGYWYQSLEWIDGNGCTNDEFDDFVILARMKEQGSSHPLNVSYSKMLPADEDALFLVYEDDDLDKLIGMAKMAKGAAWQR